MCHTKNKICKLGKSMPCKLFILFRRNCKVFNTGKISLVKLSNFSILLSAKMNRGDQRNINFSHVISHKDSQKIYLHDKSKYVIQLVVNSFVLEMRFLDKFNAPKYLNLGISSKLSIWLSFPFRINRCFNGAKTWNEFIAFSLKSTYRKCIYSCKLSMLDRFLENFGKNCVF